MRIWTIQSLRVWRQLERKKPLRVDRAIARRENPEFAFAYDWMAGQMSRRLGPQVGGWPWWGWSRLRNDCCARPDLRTVAWWHPYGEENVRLELDLDADEVLLSDYEAWHAVLNGWFHSHSESEHEAFERACKRATDGEKCAAPGGSLWPRVVRSWDRIFRFDGGDPEWKGRPEDRSIQATFWVLRLAQIKNVTFFTGRRVASR